jgi:hypothetical protein
MALLRLDGFDLYPGLVPGIINGWTLSGGTASALLPRVGRGGLGYCAHRSPGGDWTMKDNPGPNYIRLFQGVAHEFISAPSANAPVVLSVYDGTTVQFGVRIVAVASGYGLAVYRGTTQLAVSALLPTLILGSWSYIELDVVVDNTAGSYEVRFNTVPVPGLSATGIDTAQTANNFANGWGFTSTQNSSAFDDYYCCDSTGPAPFNTFLGDITVSTLMPGSNSAVQFTPSTGANWQTVDDMILSTTDYNESLTTGHVDKFGMLDLPNVPSKIYAVATVINMAKIDSGIKTIRSVLDSGGVVANGGTATPVLNTPMFRTDMFINDPNGGTAWSAMSGATAAAKVNALLAGYELTP